MLDRMVLAAMFGAILISPIDAVASISADPAYGVLGSKERMAIDIARTETAAMATLATTPQEKRLASETRRLVEQIAALVERRASERYVITQARHRADKTAELRYVQQHNETNLEFLKLQQQMQQQSRRYTTISNVLKTKHDTVKNSINNIR